jgi:hypothetical protein
VVSTDSRNVALAGPPQERRRERNQDTDSKGTSGARTDLGPARVADERAVATSAYSGHAHLIATLPGLVRAILGMYPVLIERCGVVQAKDDARQTCRCAGGGAWEEAAAHHGHSPDQNQAPARQLRRRRKRRVSHLSEGAEHPPIIPVLVSHCLGPRLRLPPDRLAQVSTLGLATTTSAGCCLCSKPAEVSRPGSVLVARWAQTCSQWCRHETSNGNEWRRWRRSGKNTSSSHRSRRATHTQPLSKPLSPMLSCSRPCVRGPSPLLREIA